MKSLPILFAGVVVSLMGCRPEETTESATPPQVLSASQREQYTQRGNEAASSLVRTLSTQLKAALQSGPPAEAVKVCQQVALPLTESTGSQLADATLRRTSLKPRNPKNAPDEVDRLVMVDWEEQLANGKAAPGHELKVVDQVVRYYQPLITQAVCLKCHGDDKSFAPALHEVLDSLYPNDQARGFKEGDLRGAIRVDFELTETSP